MDIKELNKSQLIFLAVLLSFVTSIATGITTVILMEQAPSSVTVPINRIVRQTVEKIQQVEGKTTVQTVVIKEEDLVVDAIAKNQSAVFTVSKEVFDPLTNITDETSAGRGFAISDKGVIVADATLVFSDAKYYVKNGSGKFKANFISSDKAGFSFLQIGEPVDGKSKPAFTVSTFGDLSKMKAGQKILVLGSAISSFIFDGDKDVKLSITKSNAGGMVLNLDGEVLGMTLYGENTSFVANEAISEALKLITVPVTTPTTSQTPTL